MKALKQRRQFKSPNMKFLKKKKITCLMKYIRKKILCKKQPVLMTDFISCFERTLNENGFTLER